MLTKGIQRFALDVFCLFYIIDEHKIVLQLYSPDCSEGLETPAGQHST